MKVKCMFGGVCVGILFASLAHAALAQSPVTLTIDTGSRGYAIPPDFAGVSIFTGTQVPGHRGVPGNLFSGTNHQLITLFTNSGIHHLRLGATGSPNSGARNLNRTDIDSLFAFAKATHIKVIYSLHYLDGVATAKYVWDHYRPWLDCFAIDNEPDNRRKGGSGAAVGKYTNYLAGWRTLASAVTNILPGAKFAGPDAAGRTLALRFAKSERNSGVVSLITQHFYVGGNPIKRGVDTRKAIENMLSRTWVTNQYPRLYHDVLRPVMKEGFPFRLTESDDYTHGVANASNAFASALWALDYLHWWAAHGASGVNFQNTEWLVTDTFHPDSSGNYQIYPKAYAIKAFDLGSRGNVEQVAMANPDGLNLTAYAVGDASNLYVTVINKEHGPGARAATVRILANDFSSGGAEVMFLIPPNGDIAATNGITLGGAPISNEAPWRGRWATVKPAANGQCTLVVPAASAVVVKMSAF